MNQEKIGKFIAKCRKENGYTQMSLAEKLDITDRAISKWENGKSMPDASIMLELCELLKISVNELLTGEHIIMDNYKDIAEQNLVEMKKLEESLNRKYLRIGTLLSSISMLAGLVIVLENCILDSVIGNILAVIGGIVWIAVILIWMPKERTIGYYECPKCQNRYLPDMDIAQKAPQKLFSRNHEIKLKCPNCEHVGYHKKVLSK